jgi:hypothetical protein
MVKQVFEQFENAQLTDHDGPYSPIYYYIILHQLYIKSLVIIISQSQLLSVSLVFDNCQLFYVVISTHNQILDLLTIKN